MSWDALVNYFNAKESQGRQQERHLQNTDKYKQILGLHQ